jgi:4,5-dihydroxyphthalate decarboxylase
MSAIADAPRQRAARSDPSPPGSRHVIDALRRERDRGEDPLPFGIEALRTSLTVVIDYALAQKLIPRRYAVEELFDPRTRDLV